MASKEGQPDSVADEYRKVAKEYSQLYQKVHAEVDKIVAVELKAEAAKKC